MDKKGTPNATVERNSDAEHAFSCNIAKKVKNFAFMTLEEALKADPVATAKFIIKQYG